MYNLIPTCDDGIDNDDDGRVDFDGAGVGAADPQCGGDPSASEKGPACGLGFEAVVFVLLWQRLQRRRATR